MRTWSVIIEQIQQNTGLKPGELSNALGVESRFIADLKSGRSKNPSSDFISRLITGLHINPYWIFADDANMIETSRQNAAFDQIFMEPSEKEVGAPIGGDKEQSLIVHRLNGRNAIELSIMKADPEIGYVDFYRDQRAGMGPGKDVQDYAESIRLPIIRQFLQPYSPEQVRALEARGDSMSKIGIFDRDIVLFVPTEQEGDGVYVISRDNKLQVKRLEFDITDEELRIISENDRYQPKVLRGEDANSIVIEGKVIGWLHRHPY